MAKAAKVAPRPKVTVDIRRILADVGGPDALIAAHSDFGFEPLNFEQVKNWGKRHTIPTERLVEVLVAMRALCGENAVDIFEYLRISNVR